MKKLGKRNVQYIQKQQKKEKLWQEIYGRNDFGIFVNFRLQPENVKI